MKYLVIEKTRIASDKKTILEHLTKVEKLRKWSPWLCADPSCKIETPTGKNGQTQEIKWKGFTVGEGSVFFDEISDSEIRQSVEIRKPFKAVSKVVWRLKEKKDGVVVSWQLQGPLPLLLVFLRKYMVKTVSKDFVRGLKRLKYVIEQPDKKLPVLDFEPHPIEAPAFTFYGEKVLNVSFDKLPEEMRAKFKQINIEKNKAGTPCTIVDKVRFVEDRFDLRVGYTGEFSEQEAEKTQSFPGHKAIKVTLVGSYDFLPDAWATARLVMNALELKQSKMPSYEKYIKGSGDDILPENYVTEVYIPVKG